MKLLLISPIFPYPPDAGAKQRIFNVIRAIRQMDFVKSLDLFCFSNSSIINNPDFEFIKSFFDNVYISDVSNAHFRVYSKYIYHDSFLVRLLYHLSSFKPRLFRELYSDSFFNLIKSINFQKYDFIWAERIFTAEMFLNYSNKIILDLDDIEHLKKYRELKTISFYPSLLLEYLDYYKLKFYERRLLKRFLKVLVCSEQDKARLSFLKDVFVVPNVVQVPPCIDDSKEISNTVVFVGTMHYYPNIDAINYFMSSIFPHLKKLNKYVKFYIVGGKPPQEIKRWHNGKDVVVTGYVPNVHPFLEMASVIVVPLRIGGGTRIKILEALAYGKSVVTTSLGAEGLEVQNDKHLIIENNPISFAEKVNCLLSDKNIRMFLGQNGRILVKQKYSFSVLLDKIKLIFKSLRY